MANIATFTTPGALRLYRDRYHWPNERLAVIENGFDEESFVGLKPLKHHTDDSQILLHSGIIYPEWRDPRSLFQALRRLIDAGHPGSGRLKVRFRAAVHDEFIAERARECGVSNYVELLPAIPYRDALQEMMSADALLVMQSQDCNDQIPAKSYEYLRASRPLLILADEQGDTGGLFTQTAGAYVAALEDTAAVETALRRLIDNLQQETIISPEPSLAARYTREAQTGQLSRLLDGLVTTA